MSQDHATRRDATPVPSVAAEMTKGAASVAAETASPVRFEDLGLTETVLKAVRDLRYQAPTPVQAAAIPAVLEGRDLLAAAQTGTGKTAAFLLPALNNLGHVARRGRDRRASRNRGPLMLIITPTRELAQQIEEVCLKIAKRTRHISVTVVGGLSYNPQKSALARGCDVLVATPGRLVDLIGQGACNLSEVAVLVLDEADRMLDMGFLPDVRRIVEHTPADRQTLLFSATLDERAVGSITDLVTDPVRVEIAPATSTADTVEQYVLPVSLEAKNALLAQVLKREGAQRVIVFTRTKHRADACCKRLSRAGIKALAIHGDRSQAQRERALADFRAGRVDALVATDVLARGIDVPEVRYVVNFDVPEDPTDYIHRIGRTGRAGEIGWSLTFVTEQDLDDFRAVEALMGKTADLFDAGDLPVGDRPPHLDPDRVPEAAPTKKKTRRGKSRSKKKDAPRPARPKRAGKTRVRPAVDEAKPKATDTPASAEPSPSTDEVRPERNASADHGDWSRHDARVARERRQRVEGRRLEDEGSKGRRPGGKRPGGNDHSRSARRRDGERSGRDAVREEARTHDWRNSDLPSGRERRAGRGGRSDNRAGRFNRDGRNQRSAARRTAANARRARTRRPGDGGGK